MENIVRVLSFFFDKIIYGFIPAIYDFITLLARQNIFKDDTIEKFSGNIYAILGIYVLFRLAFVLLSAIVDPNKLMDKEKGFGKIMTRFIIGIFLIVGIPWGFEYAYKVQDLILEKDIITRIVFGGEVEEGKTVGATMAKTTLNAFFTCNEGSDTDCTALNGAFNSAFPTDETAASSWSALDNLITEKGDNGYKYQYSAFISTACGVVILLLLITFSFDVAVRVVKLGFLQLITPLAVAGYIEPGGKGFSSWLKITTSTFLNLFIRLLALSFAGFIFSLINSSSIFTPLDGETISSSQEFLLRVFIIIGTLMFVKEAPKIIADMFGIKDAGFGGLNPFKKINGMVGAGLIGGAFGVGAKVAGAGIGGVAGGFAARGKGGNALIGSLQGMKTGFNNTKLKDASKGGITGISKSLKTGTIGAMGKGRDYAAGRVTGKDEKLGFINSIKRGMASTASEAHVKSIEANDAARWAKMGGKGTYSTEYQKAIDNIKDAKKQLKSREDAKSYWQGLYANNPAGSYVGSDGNTYTYKEAYERSNNNFTSAQKNLDYFKSELDSMNKLDAFKSDAETKAFVDRMSSLKDTNDIVDQIANEIPQNYNVNGEDKRKIKPIIDYSHDVNHGNAGPGSMNESSNFVNDNGETKTRSGIIMPDGFNPNDKNSNK